jgi:hypothetical protein
MKATQVLKMQAEIIGRQLAEMVDGLSHEQIFLMPERPQNSLGFLAWHFLRVWDQFDSLILEQEDLYISGGWREKFGFDVNGLGIDGSGVGTGFTREEVALVRPQAETLLAYYAAVAERAFNYLENAADAELVREMVVPWWPNPAPVVQVLVHNIEHCLIHIGEAWAARELALQKLTIKGR